MTITGPYMWLEDYVRVKKEIAIGREKKELLLWCNEIVMHCCEKCNVIRDYSDLWTDDQEALR